MTYTLNTDPSKMTNAEFIAEVSKRGTIAISQIPTTGNALYRWLRVDGFLNYYVGEEKVQVMAFYKLPGKITSICFIIDISEVDCIPMDIALEMIDKLPFGAEPSPKTYMDVTTTPSGAGIWLKKH